MSDTSFELDDIARLIHLVESRHLSELVVEDGDRRIAVRGAKPGSQAVRYVPSQAAGQAEADGAAVDEGVPLTAPMVGVFYRSSSPDEPPFVEAGDTIEPGQTIGIIEAMKVFSEVPAERGGVVTRIAAENGHLIRQGEPILFLQPA